MFKILIAAPIKESILFSWMTMKITIRYYSSFMMHILNQLLSKEYCRMQVPIRLNPFPIQINSQQWTSIISIYHSIYIQHRYYPKHKIFPQLISLVRYQIINKSLKHLWALRLPRMHSRSNNDSFLRMMVLNVRDQLLIIPFKTWITLYQCFLISQIKLVNLFF